MSELSSAAAAMGRSRTAKKVEAARDNVAKARESLSDPEVRERHKKAQQERRERERLEKEARLALAPRPVKQLVLPETVPVAVEKKSVGRPRIRPIVEAGEKRGRGRPRKPVEGVQA